MNITDTSCKHVNTEISNHLTLVRISTFTSTDNSVFFSTDGTYLSLDRHSMLMSDLYKFFCLLNVLVDRIMRSVKHDGWESCFYTFQASFVAAVIKMKSNRNCNSKFFHHSIYHSHNSLITCHVLSCTLWYSKNNRRVKLLSCCQDCLCPLKVVDVELANCVMTCFCFLKHFCSWY